MGRAPCCEKVGLKRGRWTAEEDEILVKYIQKNGEGSWRSLPKNAGLLRCGKSCRLRWINYLRADLKRGNFSTEEELTIINLHRSVGNRWSLIASHLPGRTDNEVKNYWNSHLSRKLYSFRSSNCSTMTSVETVKVADTGKRRGGRVSRSIAKKYNKSTRRSSIMTTSAGSSRPECDAPKGTVDYSVTTENTKARDSSVGETDASSRIQEFTDKGKRDEISDGLAAQVISWEKDLEMELVSIFDEFERGSNNSFHESCSESLEVFLPGTNFGTPKKLEQEIEVPGAYDYERPNDVTTLLGQIEGRESGTMALESTMINQESDSNGSCWNSNSDIGKLDESFSPLNSCFEAELAKWDLDAAALDFGLWDEGRDFLLWV